MGRTFGGRKRIYKKKSRKPASLQYQEFVRSQYANGLVPSANGKWIPHSSLSSENIKSSYARVCGVAQKKIKVK